MNERQATSDERRQLEAMIARRLKLETGEYGVVAVGSVAAARARQLHDVDGVVFMHLANGYILPTESIRCPWDDTFPSIIDGD